MQAPKVDFNGVLIIGGLIAGAYIIYKVSKAGGAVVDTISNGAAVVKNAVTAVSDAGKTAVYKFIPPEDSRKTNPFGNVFSSGNTAQDPMNSTGEIYNQTMYDEMGNIIY